MCQSLDLFKVYRKLSITLYSTNQTASQVRIITEHPFVVHGDISDVKTNLALMRIRTERLQSYNQPEDVELVRAALAVPSDLQ